MTAIGNRDALAGSTPTPSRAATPGAGVGLGDSDGRTLGDVSAAVDPAGEATTTGSSESAGALGPVDAIDVPSQPAIVRATMVMAASRLRAHIVASSRSSSG
jgi:hypothetical protein